MPKRTANHPLTREELIVALENTPSNNVNLSCSTCGSSPQSMHSWRNTQKLLFEYERKIEDLEEVISELKEKLAILKYRKGK